MVFSQEPASSVCQLWGPGIQATLVQFIKQFTMSLPNCQPRGMGIMGLISPLQQLLFLKGFGHRQCSYCPGHWSFLLGVCKYAVLFLTTMTAFLLPCLNSVYVFCTVRPCGKEPSSVHKACTMMLMHSPLSALPAFTGMMQEEKGSMVSAFLVYINWS